MPNSFLANLDWNSSGELARSDFEQVLSALLKMSELTTEDVSKTESHTTQEFKKLPKIPKLVGFQQQALHTTSPSW